MEGWRIIRVAGGGLGIVKGGCLLGLVGVDRGGVGWLTLRCRGVNINRFGIKCF